jgi:flagellar biosynthetic protein FliR
VTVLLPPGLIVAFLLVTTRMVATLTVAPPFGGSSLPIRVRLAVAVAIGLMVAPRQPPEVTSEIGSAPAGSILMIVAYQVLVGALFGYVIQLLLSASLIGGAFVDHLAGFSSGSLFDPFANAAVTPTARLNQLITTIVLVVTDGHLLIVRGVLRSYEVAPLDGFRVETLGPLLERGAGILLLAALEMTFPLVVALLLAEVVLGLAVKAAPRLNVMVVGFALKSLVLLLAFALTLPLLINGVASLLDRSVRWAVAGVGG